MAHDHELDPQLYDPVTFDNQNDLNLIIDERILFDREYILLDREKVETALNNPTELLNIFNNLEICIFLEQALQADYISDDIYENLKLNHSLIFDNMLMNDIHTLLLKQYTYITKIPNIKDLENNGLLDSIIGVIQENPDILISEPLVCEYTDNHLFELLKIHQFISFEKAELVLDNLKDTNYILQDKLITLLHRIKPYLSFITDTKIQYVQTQLDNDINNILEIFTVNEIKLIIDKEIELKYYLLKILTPSTIEKMFEKFKDELLTINLIKMVDDQFKILKDEMMELDYSGLVQSQVDNYLTISYNTLMRDTLNNSFNTFKNEFIQIDLKAIIKEYFDELSQNIFGNNYDLIIQEHIENNLPRLTDNQMQIWIKQYTK